MKNTKLCPKCNSTNLLKIPGKHTGYGAGKYYYDWIDGFKCS